ncbi:MAG TPA: ABC transporter ATP-binding protein [Acidimicrobiales bacterium]|nr:ABC transporter ATP-binding protein [Acidimicrobiales bacterium]
MTRVVVSGLRKSFGARVVLDGLDLEVPEGSLTAVLGPSGSGKTTLLRILAGFERPEAGSVTLGENVVEDGRTHLPPEARRVGYVPQDGALFPHLSASGNVGFGLSRRERRSGRVEELLGLVGLSGEGRRFPHQLSGGMQQRVALARALAGQPSLVLLDEPFSSLDAALRAGVRADVARVLSETGTTSVLVTHDQDEALSLADRVAVLRGGRVVQCASPEQLYTDPLDPALASFVGDANLLEGTVRAGTAVTPLGTLAIADDGRPLAEAQKVMVLVRPEQLELRTSNASNGGGGIDGLVVECRYFGHDMLVTVEMAAEVKGRRPLLYARLTGRSPLGSGSPVALSVAGPVKAWPAGSG